MQSSNKLLYIISSYNINSVQKNARQLFSMQL